MPDLSSDAIEFWARGLPADLAAVVQRDPPSDELPDGILDDAEAVLQPEELASFFQRHAAAIPKLGSARRIRSVVWALARGREEGRSIDRILANLVGEEEEGSQEGATQWQIMLLEDLTRLRDVLAQRVARRLVTENNMELAAEVGVVTSNRLFPRQGV